MKAVWRPRADAAADPEAAFNLATRLAADGDIDGAREAYRQVAGLIGDLPSCAELLEQIMSEAGRCLDRLDATRKT